MSLPDMPGMYHPHGTLGVPWPIQGCVESVWLDVRLGLRTLLKAPLFTVAGVLTH